MPNLNIYNYLFGLGFPEVDGGSPVTECELVMRSAEQTNDSNSCEQLTVYQGKETECVVTELLPGHRYLFLLRASNRVGVSIIYH